MNLLKTWTDHCDALEQARKRIEEMSALLPGSGPGKRVRDGVLKAWKTVTASSDELDDLITGSVQPLPVDFPWQDRDFVKHWQLYRDYLQEQHGMVMKSRMEQARLNAILKFADSNRQVFIDMLNFYMALGSVGIFQVNFENSKTTEENGEQIKQIRLRLD